MCPLHSGIGRSAARVRALCSTGAPLSVNDWSLAFNAPLLGVKAARVAFKAPLLAFKDVLLAVKVARFAFKGMPMPQGRRWLALSDARLPQTDGFPSVRDASVALVSPRAWLSMRQLRPRAQALGRVGYRSMVITQGNRPAIWSRYPLSEKKSTRAMAEIPFSRPSLMKGDDEVPETPQRAFVLERR